MTIQRQFLFTLVIVVFGLVCSGCVGTGVDLDTPLEKAAEKQRSIESLTYIETLSLNLNNETMAVEYDVRLKKPDKFRRLETSGSFIRSEIVSNGDVVWIYDPEKNTVLIRNMTPSEKIPEPAIYAFLTGNISEKYVIEYQEMESLNSTPIYKIKLTPHKLNNEDIREYLLWIDSDNLIPLKLESWDNGNPVLTLEYRDYLVDYITSDDEFTFTIPDGVSVVYA